MRTHQEIDARSLAMHRLIAEKVRREPALLEAAKATLARWRSIGDASTRAYDEQWERALSEGLEATLRVALEDSERGDAMRQCSPFPGILTPRERFAFLRAWKDSHE
jgi:enoyl-CoA hydratase/carnithine racemase